MKFKSLSYGVGLSLILVNVSIAQPPLTVPSQAVSTSSMLLQVMLALGFIVALILGSAWLLKRLNLVQNSTNTHFKVLSSMPMGRKERLLLIEVDGVKLLLGVSAGAINVLHHFDNQATSQTNKQLPVVWGENTTATDNDLQKNTG